MVNEEGQEREPAPVNCRLCPEGMVATMDPARTVAGTETEVAEEMLKVTLSPSAKATGDAGLLTYQLETVRSQVPEEPPFQVMLFADKLVLVTVPVKIMSGLWLFTIRKVPLVLEAP